MSDPRMQRLARLVVNYSISVKPKEKVIIDCTFDSIPMAKALVKEIYAAGGHPFVNYTDDALTSELMAGTDREHLENIMKYDAWKTLDVDAWIKLNIPRNKFENSIIADEQLKNITRWKNEIKAELGLDKQRPEVKPCVMTFPTHFTAHLAQMGTDEYADFYYQACLANYRKMAVSLEVLAELMSRTNEVHLVGMDTDLKFSLKGMKTLVSAGDRNMPDGEAYCSPVKDSLNGIITYNIPSPYEGIVFENIRFEFKEGKIVKATSNYTDRLNKILDTDEGARHIGEFAITVNPMITRPTGSILFDEKMTGAIHLTPGNEIWKTGNGNRSMIHWDIVYSQLPQHGGGEIWFDGKLIRRDGRFVPEKLHCLNPENLMESPGE